MYVLVIGRGFPNMETGMYGTFEYEQAVALSKQGLKSVYAFCDTRSLKLLRKISFIKNEENQVSTYGWQLPIGGLPRKVFESIKGFLFIKTLDKIIAEHGNPDMIHIHYPLLNLNEEIWKYLQGLEKPIIITEHWSKVQENGIEDFRRKLLEKVVNESDYFICVGDQLKKSIYEITKTDKFIDVIPNMLHSAFYYKKEKKNKEFTYVSIGRLVHSKRFDVLIEAFAKAFGKGPDVKLKIIGSGPLSADLKKRINELQLNGRVKLCGSRSREEIADILRGSDAFVSASELETFGVPFIEAMACGVPVISENQGAITKYIHEANGLTFERNDIDDLARSMRQLHQGISMYSPMKISEEALAEFSEEAVTKKIKVAYLKCQD